MDATLFKHTMRGVPVVGRRSLRVSFGWHCGVQRRLALRQGHWLFLQPATPHITLMSPTSHLCALEHPFLHFYMRFITKQCLMHVTLYCMLTIDMNGIVQMRCHVLT